MGVRVIDVCDSCDEDSCYSCCSSPTISTNSKNSTATTTITSKQQKYQNLKSEAAATENTPINFALPNKDLIDNCKEFRIENNKSNLRIIGNGNRIRIMNNMGNLNIIGNATRLKIIYNNGHIKYTGNDGRIYLGSESKQQQVDYIGCNGILKVINSLELNGGKGKCNQSKNKCKGAVPVACNGKVSESNMKVKSASFGGSQWQQFNAAFDHNRGSHRISLPDLLPNSKSTADTGSTCRCKTTKFRKTKQQYNVSNNVNIINNFGNIVIRNSVNVNI